MSSRPSQFASKTGDETPGLFLCSNAGGGTAQPSLAITPPPLQQQPTRTAHSAHSTQPALRPHTPRYRYRYRPQPGRPGMVHGTMVRSFRQTNPRRRAGPTQSVYALPFPLSAFGGPRPRTQGRRKGTSWTLVHPRPYCILYGEKEKRLQKRLQKEKRKRKNIDPRVSSFQDGCGNLAQQQQPHLTNLM